MRNKNTIIIISVLLVLLIALVVLNLASLTKPIAPIPIPVTPTPYSIHITPIPNQNQVFFNDQSPPPPTTTASTYSINTTITSNKASQIAAQFSLTTKPETYQSNGKVIYRWEDETQKLIIDSPPIRLAYRLSSLNSLPKGAPTADEALAATVAYIDKLGLLPSSIKVTLNKAAYYSYEGGEAQATESNQNANITALDLDYAINNARLILSTASPHSAHFEIGKNNRVASFSFFIPDSLTETSGPINLNLNQAKLALINNQGYLIESSLADNSYGASTINFKNATISKSYSAVSLISDSNILEPSVIFEGLAPSLAYPSQQYAITYLVPAGQL